MNKPSVQLILETDVLFLPNPINAGKEKINAAPGTVPGPKLCTHKLSRLLFVLLDAITIYTFFTDTLK